MKQMFNKTILAVTATIAFTVASVAYGQTPYQGSLIGVVSPKGADPGTELFLTFPAIQAGKRLLIDEVRLRSTVGTGENITCSLTSAQPQAMGMLPAVYYLAKPVVHYTNQSAKSDLLGIDDAVKLAVDGGVANNLTLHCTRIGSQQFGGGGAAGAGPWSTLVTIVGRLTDAFAVMQ